MTEQPAQRLRRATNELHGLGAIDAFVQRVEDTVLRENPGSTPLAAARARIVAPCRRTAT